MFSDLKLGYILLLIFTLSVVAASEDNVKAWFRVYGQNSSVYSNETRVKFKAIENMNVTAEIELIYSTPQVMNTDARDYSVQCNMSYDRVAVLVNWTDVLLGPSDGANKTKLFQVTMFPRRLGGSFLLCRVLYDGMNKSLSVPVTLLELVVSRVQTVAEIIFRVVVIVLIVFITFVMGCGLDRNIIWGYFKKPVSPLIGFSSQYLIMPLVAFGLAKATGIDNAFGLGLLTIGCSPGGGASNVWTVLLGGDLNLSMTMTFLSTVAALGMMPLWLFLLGRFFIDPSIVKIPYGSIMITLLQVVIPAGLGLLFRYKFEKAAIALAKKTKIVGLVFIIFILTYGTYANLYIYKLMGDYMSLMPIGACLPWIGFGLGALLSFLMRRQREQCITIALETGFQNIGIAILILKFSMPQPGGDLGSAMPVIVAIFTPLPLYIIYIVILIKRRFCPEEKSDEDNEQQKQQVEDGDVPPETNGDLEMGMKESLLEKPDHDHNDTPANWKMSAN